MENPCDDDTREIVQGILTEAKAPKFSAIICDLLFRLVEQRKRQQKRDNITATPPKTRPPPKTKKKNKQRKASNHTKIDFFDNL